MAETLPKGLSAERRKRLLSSDVPLHSDTKWWSMKDEEQKLMCSPGACTAHHCAARYCRSFLHVGRMLYLLYAALLQRNGTQILSQLSAAATWKWSKLLSIGKPGVNMLTVPPVVWTRRTSSEWSDADTNPAYRPKGKAAAAKKARVVVSEVPAAALPTAQDELDGDGGVPSELTSGLSGWSVPGAASRTVLTPRAGDADDNEWITIEKGVHML